MIEIKNLSKSFPDKDVLKDLNITIEDGKVFGLVGINGSGKSTLLRLISGIYNADDGTILIDGEDVYENEKTKSNIFFLPDEPYYSSNTTPLTLVPLYETYYKLDKEEYISRLNDFKIPLKKSMKNFSKGMKRQVFISLALAIKPKYLLLDEAFDGLDPLARLTFKKSLVSLIEDYGSTIIISSHSLRELEDICDSYGLLDNMNIASGGDIKDAIDSVHKYQVAFDYVPNKDDFKVNFIKYEQDQRIIKVVVKEDSEAFSSLMKEYKPLIIDEVAIDFEELFIIEVESRGYINGKNS